METFAKKYDALKAEVIESLMKLIIEGKNGVMFVDINNDEEGEILEMPYHLFDDRNGYNTTKRFAHRAQKDVAINQVVFSFYSLDDSSTLFIKAIELPLDLLITLEQITRNHVNKG